MSTPPPPAPEHVDELSRLRRELTALRLEREHLRRTREIQRRATLVLERLAGGAPLEEMLLLLVESIEDVKPDMLGSVLVLEGNRLRRGAAPSLPKFYNEAVDGLEIGPAVGSCGTCAHTGERVIVEDVMTHPYWAEFRDLAQRAGLRACWSHPILSSSGRILGTFAMYYREPRQPDSTDLELITFAAHIAGITIERAQTEEAVQAGERRFQALVENAPVCICEIDLDGRLVSMNRVGVRMAGAQDAAEIAGKSFLECVAGHDRTRVSAQLERAYGGEAVELEFNSHESLGLRILSMSLTPLTDNDGRVVRLMGVTQDITERREAEQRRALMVQELDHRVKNNLATVLSIAHQTAEGSTTLEDFEDSFNGRIRSMAVAHEMLAQSSWQSVELFEMLTRLLKPYRRENRNRIVLTGPVLSIPARVAAPLCMVLHELAVNAAKHGALSNTEGQVTLTWTREVDDEGREILDGRWVESGGPPVAPPARKGRGTNLIERMIGYQLHGRASLSFDPGGVECRLSVPVSGVRAEAAS
ncbi:MAG: sensor histidine kinase [Planctomycetota bacterium]